MMGVDPVKPDEMFVGLGNRPHSGCFEGMRCCGAASKGIPPQNVYENPSEKREHCRRKDLRWEQYRRTSRRSTLPKSASSSRRGRLGKHLARNPFRTRSRGKRRERPRPSSAPATSRPAAGRETETQTAREVLTSVLRLMEAPRPPTTVLHACAAPFQAIVYPSPTSREIRRFEGRLSVALSLCPCGSSASRALRFPEASRSRPGTEAPRR